MKILKIPVIDKVAQSIDDCIVCGNSGYIIEFAFDNEWQSEKVKTARFIFNGAAVDVVFEGDSVPVPVISNATTLAVGVYAGDLQTTTPALISCKKSILCEDGMPPDPTPEVYAQIIELINNTMGLSAYDVACKNGFIGSETEWLESLHGATGEAGADGKTPVKGKDYYTEEDKSELVTDVINALPVWNGGAY